MRILGIDHSIKSTGWALLEDGKIIDTGIIHLFTEGDMRLVEFRKCILELLHHTKPDRVALELPSHQRGGNITRLLTGLYTIALEASMEVCGTVEGINPMSMKKFITGHGKADKRMVYESIINKFEVPEEKVFEAIYYKKKPDVVKEYIYDKSDACALAIYVDNHKIK